MSTPSLGTLDIDLPRLLETRLLIQANSGGGKSWLVRRLLEQTASGVQQLVIDVEGEFSTLREKFDYIICAPSGGDAVATPATAAALARALWESGASAIVDIFDLQQHERTAFVRLFVESLITAPRAIWHPTMVLLDEIQLFAPQTGGGESLSAVIDLATRGRKRGLALVGATLRLADLSKSVAAELNNKLTGRMRLDVDVARAAFDLGVTKTKALQMLKSLPTGQFYAEGPALCEPMQLTTIGPVITTHLQSGQRLMVAPPPASKAILAKLQKIEGLQKSAVEEATTVEGLTAQLAAAKRQLAIADKITASARPAGVSEDEVLRRIGLAIAPFAAERVRLHDASAMLVAAFGKLHAEIGKPPEEIVFAAPPRLTDPPKRKEAVVDKPGETQRTASKPRQPGAELTGPEQRILDALAWLESIGVDAPEHGAVAFIAGYSPTSTSYTNPRSRLKTAEHIVYQLGARISLTARGRALANAPGAPASTAELHARVLERLGGPEQRILNPVLHAYPKAVGSVALASLAGYSPVSTSFTNPRARLKSLGLVEYVDGGVRARDFLFPEPGRGR